MNDINLAYIKRGKGFPLILLHGNGESKEYFSNQIEEFSKYFEVFAIDTRGHGESPRGEKPFTIRQFAEDLNDFMISFKIEKAHILGFSDGANIAMVFAAKYPEKVNKLILNGGNLEPSGVKRIYQKPIEKEYEKALILAQTNERAKMDAELLALMVLEPDITKEELSRINAKTLVIVGENDMIKNRTRNLYIKA